MMENEFDDLRGKLRPDYNRPEIPTELKEVKKEKKHFPDVGFGWSDYWNVIKAVFRNEALSQLNGQPSLITMALSARYILLAGVIISAIVMIVGLFK